MDKEQRFNVDTFTYLLVGVEYRVTYENNRVILLCACCDMASAFLHTFLLFMNPSMQDTSNVPLCRAAERGHTETVEILVEGGANVNHQKMVRSVLHHATLIWYA